MDSREGFAVGRLNQLLTLILESAAVALGFEGATATVRSRDGYSTLAATDVRMLTLDEAQYSSGVGPCLEALDASAPVVWSEAEAEQAWVAFRDAAREAGVLSSLSVHVPLDEPAEIAASLNFYAEQRRTLSAQQLRSAELFAAQLAAALQSVEAQQAAWRVASQLAGAMRSRAVIEQAKGILMAEHGMSESDAFGLLERDAEGSTLREAAARIVDRFGR